MSMFGGLEISASGLTAQRLRMDVTAMQASTQMFTKTLDLLR
jgi:flagellar basal-body rod protein FlgC